MEFCMCHLTQTYSSMSLPSPIGTLTVLTTQDAVWSILFEDEELPLNCVPQETTAGRACIRALESYFAGEIPDISPIPFRIRGTKFQQAVWRALADVPYGQTATYGDLAVKVIGMSGAKTSPRAVGSALSRNPLPLLVPCHRVIGKNGSLTGFRGGLERKRWLLDFEKNFAASRA